MNITFIREMINNMAYKLMYIVDRSYALDYKIVQRAEMNYYTS